MKDKLGSHLKELISAEKWKELEDLLLNTEDEWVLEVLDRFVCEAQGPQLVRGLLTALSCTTQHSTTLRHKIYQSVLKTVQEELLISGRTGAELVGVLMVQLDPFPAPTLLSLFQDYVHHIDAGLPLQGRWVDLLGKVVRTLSQKEEVWVNGAPMAGDEYRYHALKTLCDLSWSPETTVSLLPVFRDMDLPKEELQDVVFKVERVLKKADYQSVPPIIYHLIPLMRKQLLPRALQLIIDYFNKQEHKLKKAKDKNKSSSSVIDSEINSDVVEDDKQSQLIEAQGTVILHVTHHAQYSSSLVRDYIKLIKASSWLTETLITPFNLALTLSLASNDRYQDQILDSLKSCLLKHFREEERTCQCQWLQETWGEQCDVVAVLQATADHCVMGWDQVSEGLVQLSFSLLESGGGPKGETYPSQRAVELGTLVLPQMVRKQPHLARPVLSRLTNSILSASTPALYISILAKLAKSLPMILLDNYNMIFEPLEYMEFLSEVTAVQLLQAYRPLLRMSMTLKDALIIILRKLLFAKRIESRQIAVQGFLHFLGHFRVIGTLPSSQSSVTFSSSLSSISVATDVHSAFNTSTNESLCRELLGVLRRCFSLQHQVKSTLYLGLYEVCQTNPQLVVSVLEMLLPHTKTYVDLRPDVLNPVMLKKVIGVQGELVVLAEPIADLLTCLGACKTYYEDHRDTISREEGEEEDVIAVLNDICSIFDVLTEKLAGCDLGDMDVNVNGDWSTDCAAGQRNVLTAQTMVAVFDSLMEHTFSQASPDKEGKMHKIISLFKSQRKVISAVKEKSVKPGKKGEASQRGKKGEEANVKRGRASAKANITFKSNLSLAVTAKIMALCCSAAGDDDEGDSSDVLRQNRDFQVYLLTVVEEHLSSFKLKSALQKDKMLPHLRTVARVLLLQCNKAVEEVDASDERQVLKLRQSLLLLASVFTLFTKFYKSRLESILKEMLGKTNSSSQDALLYKVAKHCQKMILKILHNEEREPLLRDAVAVVNILITVTQVMEADCSEVKELQEWVLQLCKDQELDHGGLAEAVLNLLIKLSDKVKANHKLTKEIAKELHHKLGNIEEGVEAEECGKYNIVTENTALSVLASFLAHLDDTLTILELAINKMKACISTSTEFDSEGVEKQIVLKFALVMSGMHEIVQSALPPGTCMDQTVRVVTKLYNVLTGYVKYYLETYRLRTYPKMSEKFEKVVHMSGNLVSEHVYPFITYIDSTQRQVGKKNQGSLTARAIKESKLIPNLIFAIEKYEKHLINLSRKSKVNLMQGMKMSTARDFRIMPNALQKGIEEEIEQEEEEDEENSRNREENDGSEDSASEDSERGQNRTPLASTSGTQHRSTAKRRKSGSEEDEEDAENNPNSNNRGPELQAKKSKKLKMSRKK